MSEDIYVRDLKTPGDIAGYNKAEIARVFADTLDKESRAGIIVHKLGDTPYNSQVFVGVPYTLSTVQVELFPCSDLGHRRYDSVDVLVIGTRAHRDVQGYKEDKSKEIKIHLKEIIDFKRVELSGFLKV